MHLVLPQYSTTLKHIVIKFRNRKWLNLSPKPLKLLLKNSENLQIFFSSEAPHIPLKHSALPPSIGQIVRATLLHNMAAPM